MTVTVTDICGGCFLGPGSSETDKLRWQQEARMLVQDEDILKASTGRNGVKPSNIVKPMLLHNICMEFLSFDSYLQHSWA
jgi:hypothetical protein